MPLKWDHINLSINWNAVLIRLYDCKVTLVFESGHYINIFAGFRVFSHDLSDYNIVTSVSTIQKGYQRVIAYSINQERQHNNICNDIDI